MLSDAHRYLTPSEIAVEDGALCLARYSLFTLVFATVIAGKISRPSNHMAIVMPTIDVKCMILCVYEEKKNNISVKFKAAVLFYA